MVVLVVLLLLVVGPRNKLGTGTLDTATTPDTLVDMDMDMAMVGMVDMAGMRRRRDRKQQRGIRCAGCRLGPGRRG